MNTGGDSDTSADTSVDTVDTSVDTSVDTVDTSVDSDTGSPPPRSVRVTIAVCADGTMDFTTIQDGDLTVSGCVVSETTGTFTVLFDENFLAMLDTRWEDNHTDYLWYLIEGINADVQRNVVVGGVHESVAEATDLDNMLMTNNTFQDIQIDSALTAFDFKTNGVGTLSVLNNVFYNIDDLEPYGGRTFSLDGVDFRNNVVQGCDAWNLEPIDADSSFFWDNGVSYATSVTGSGNQYVDPEFASPAMEDFSLTAGSPAIDAGDATVSDQDGSRSDAGRYGGPYAAAVDNGSGAVAVTEVITGTTLHTLTVAGGHGGGTYYAGEVVHVWAAIDPQTEVMSTWSGGTVADPNEWATTIVMPDANLGLTATTSLADLPLVDNTYTLGGQPRSVLSAIPSSPRGIVYFFHDATQNNSQLRSNAASLTARELYAAGFGVVAMDSDIAAIAGTGG